MVRDNSPSGTTFHRVGVESLLGLPKRAQQQALRKVRETIDLAPTNVGYPLHSPLHGFRGIHSGRYRIIWRILTLEGGAEIAEVCYVGKRAEGDREDAYNEFIRLFDIPG